MNNMNSNLMKNAGHVLQAAHDKYLQESYDEEKKVKQAEAAKKAEEAKEAALAHAGYARLYGPPPQADIDQYGALEAGVRYYDEKVREARVIDNDIQRRNAAGRKAAARRYL